MEAPKIEIDPGTVDGSFVYKVLTGSVVPRPIGFISTVSRDGLPNAAPFSFFNAISTAPPLVCFAPSLRAGRPKDTLRNVTAVGDFVFNVVDAALVGPVTICAEDYRPDVSEFDQAGLHAVPSKVVRSPRVAESPVNMECRVVLIQRLPESTYTLVVGRVVYIHIREDVVRTDGRIDFQALQAIGRMAGDTFVRTDAMFRTEYDAYARVR
jgi:flavin reductase (DIM6/NTAB) family NADH-FMN oxidoreductase RutF